MKKSVLSSQAPPPGPFLKRALMAVSRQAERDIDLLSGADRQMRVHALRVRMKKLRALLPLIETGVSPATMEAIRSDMRTLKKAFARNRDQQVMESLLAELSQEKGAATRAYVRVENQTAPEAWLCELKATACSLTRRLRSLRLRSLTRTAVCAAYVRSFAKARRRYKRCKKKPVPKQMHRWRLLVKDHYFQTLMLLRDRRRCELSKTLGRLLGKIHDLAMLRDHLSNGMSEELVRVIGRRMKKLRSSAFRKARRLFACTPAKQVPA